MYTSETTRLSLNLHRFPMSLTFVAISDALPHPTSSYLPSNPLKTQPFHRALSTPSPTCGKEGVSPTASTTSPQRCTRRWARCSPEALVLWISYECKASEAKRRLQEA